METFMPLMLYNHHNPPSKTTSQLDFVCIRLELCRFPIPRISRSGIAIPHRTKYSVPECEEWLREIRLDSPALVMDVVVSCIVTCDVLQGVPGQCVTAVVINRLDGRGCEEDHSLARRHPSNQVRNASSKCIEEETFERVIIERSISVWDVKSVVA